MPGSRPLDPDEQDAVLALLPRLPSRDRLYVVLALNLGLRMRELLSLTAGQLFDGTQPRAFLRIERAQLKLGRSLTRRRSVSSRSLPLNPAAQQTIAEHFAALQSAGRLPAPRDFVFTADYSRRPLSRMQVTRILRRLFFAAGLDVSERRGSHSLRKAYCWRIWEASGHDLEVTRASLGHRHISTTQAYLPNGEAQAHALILALGEPAVSPHLHCLPRPREA